MQRLTFGSGHSLGLFGAGTHAGSPQPPSTNESQILRSMGAPDYTAMSSRLRILRTPMGEAPEHVRRAWIGLELPILHDGRYLVQGVLDTERIQSRLQLFWARLTGRVVKQQGFSVFVLDALEALERERPLEASWWRNNAPHLCVPGSVFVFDAACGERVEETEAP
jgi:hypothetical protein